jgi:FMN phosphatase YigB (HAD superfamily)
MKTNIDTVIFDVGWVLVELDFKPLLSCFAQSPQQYTMKEVIAAIDLEAHERGEFSGAELVDRLHSLTPDVDRMQLKRGWLDMFAPVQPMFDLARKLAGRYQVHLLSNVGDLHWAHLNNTYDLRALAHDVLPSFQAGVMKPDDEIYRLAEERFQLIPANTVFIDDLQPNVDASRKRGWHAIQHVSPVQTMQSLRDLGVAC